MEGQTHIWYSDEMTHLENKLSGLGYRFMITKDGELIYSNLSDEDMEIAGSVAGDAIDDAKTLTASRFEVSVIKNTFWHGEKIFCITAVHPEKTDGIMADYLKKCVFRYLYGIIAIRGCPSSSATELIKRVKLAGYHNSAEYPKSFGFWQALFMTRVISESVISALRPRPLLSCRAASMPPALYLSRHSLTAVTQISSLSAIACTTYQCLSFTNLYK